MVERVEKSWGYELIIANKSYCGKILHFGIGKKCSWHYHKIKDETFYVQSGTFIIRYSMGDDLEKAFVKGLKEGETFYVPTGLRHQMEAPLGGDLLEISTHHEDTDSYRLENGSPYGHS